MQSREILNKEKLFELIEFIFLNSEVELFESYSEMDRELLSITSFVAFKNYYNRAISEDHKFLSFGLYYRETEGKVAITRIELDSKRCNGKTYRYKIDAWGLIFIHLKIIDSDTQIECSVTANSKKRAENWESTNPELGSPELWNWKLIESHARKIINRLKKLNTPH